VFVSIFYGILPESALNSCKIHPERCFLTKTCKILEFYDVRYLIQSKFKQIIQNVTTFYFNAYSSLSIKFINY
jgi:hypothetical protein